MYYVYFFRYESLYKKELAHEFKISDKSFAYESYLRLRGEIQQETFDYYQDAIRFKEKMPPNLEFFCITNNNYHYLVESEDCKEMRKAYKPLAHAIRLTEYISYCLLKNRQQMYN